MRIIGGELRGRRFRVDIPDGVRPTGERVREAVTSALMSRGAIHCASIADIFCGSGAMGMEWLSRGAARAVFVDNNRKMVNQLQKNLQELDLSAQVINADATKKNAYRALCGLDLVYFDPPYDYVTQFETLLSYLLPALNENADVLVEFASRDTPNWPQALVEERRFVYGNTTIALLNLGGDRA